MNRNIPLVAVILLILCGQGVVSDNISYVCNLSPSANRTFMQGAVDFALREPDEAVRALSCGWAPSTNSSYSSLLLNNDSFVPTFWVVATTPSGDSSFIDSRFMLCLLFSSAASADEVRCALALDTIPGTFRFDNVVLPIGSWTFAASNFTFTPRATTVFVSSATYCCVNVTASTNVSLIQFSPPGSGNDGALYQGKSVCAAAAAAEGGSTLLPPISIDAVRILTNFTRASPSSTATVSKNEICGVVSLPTDATRGWTMTATLFVASTWRSLASWNVSLSAGQAARFTFSQLDISVAIGTVSSTVTLELHFQMLVGPVYSNVLVLPLKMSRRITALCDLHLPTLRNQPLLTTFNGQWGFPLPSGVPLPQPLVVIARSSDRRISDAPAVGATAGSDTVPFIRLDVVDENGALRSDITSSSPSAVLSDGVALFHDFLLSAAVASGNVLLWLKFSLQSAPQDEAPPSTLSMPLYLVTQSDTSTLRSRPWFAAIDSRSHLSPFLRSYGSSTSIFSGQRLPRVAIRLHSMAGGSLFGRFAGDCSVTLSLSDCRTLSAWPTSLSSPPPQLTCGVRSNASLIVYGNLIRSVSAATGVAVFDDLVLTLSSGARYTDLLASWTLTCTGSPWWSASTAGNITSNTHLIRVCASSEGSACVSPEFVSGPRLPSLFSDELQSATAVIGVPLPPIVLSVTRCSSAALCSPGGSSAIDSGPAIMCKVPNTNSTWQLRVTSDSATILHGQSVLHSGFFQLPGIIIARASAPCLRLKFAVYQSGSGLSANNVTLQLQSGPVFVQPVDQEIQSSDPSFRLRFSSASTSWITASDRLVSLPNNTALPPFDLHLLRTDGLFGRSSLSLLTDFMDPSQVSPYNVTLYGGIDVKCQLTTWWNFNGTNATFLVQSQTSTLLNGTTTVRFSAVAYPESTLRLRCCVDGSHAAIRCANDVRVEVMVGVGSISAAPLVSASASPSSESSRMAHGLSVGSPLMEIAPFTSFGGSMLTFDASISCWDNSSGIVAWKLCSANPSNMFQGVNTTFTFSIGLHSLDGTAVGDDDDHSVVTASVNAGLSDVSVSDVFDSAQAPPDGLVFAVDAAASANSTTADTVSGSSNFVALESPLTSQLTLGVVAVYLTSPATVGEGVWLRNMGIFLAPLVASTLDPDRILLRSIRPATLPRPSDGVPVASTVAEIVITAPLTTSASSVAPVSSVESNLLGAQQQCSQGANSVLPPIVTGTIAAIYGVTSGNPHGVVVASATSATATSQSFCDIFLLESIAEGSRHCELMYGADFRCACFTTLFRTLGSSCISQPIMMHICDHMAYCTSSDITSICSQIEPNIALEVFFVVGGTLLGLAVIISIVKAKSIWRWLKQDRRQLSNNSKYVRSQQSGGMIEV